MIVYFADRYFNILGQASTELPEGLTIIDDRRVGDVDSGVTVFEFTLPFNDETRALAESCGDVGHYLLRSHKGVNDFYTIIDAEVDTKRQEVTVYAEDAGLDLLNEIVEAYEADKAYNIAHYINKFVYDSGFVIGVNECGSTTKKLAFTDDATAAERIAAVAEQFGCEISYSFQIDGLAVTKKLINIYKERGNDVGVQLRLNKEIDRIITKKSITNLATALLPTGGTPENAENPINLSGYKYDDGDIYLEGRYLKSRSAIQKWSRYLNPSEPNKTYTGHILKKFSCDALTQAALCTAAVAELKRITDVEVNYEIEMNELPDGVDLGDRVNIVDDAGGLYMSARILELEESVANRSVKATIGEYLIKGSGISQKVADLAAQFAASAAEVAAAYQAAQTAKATAEAAQETAETASASVDTKVAALQIGARNLLCNSNSFVGENVSVNSDAVIGGTYEGLNVYSHDYSAATSGSADILQFKRIYPEKLGAEYTLSFYAKGAGTMNTYFYGTTGFVQCAKVVQSNGITRAAGDGSSAWTLSDAWTRYWVTWTLASEGDISVEKYVLFRLFAGASVSLCGVKLEKGNKATDWTPAPEDMASAEELANTDTKATNAATAASNAQSDIDNLEIGGRNLVFNSKGDSCTDWIHIGAVEDDDVKGKCVVKITTETKETFLGTPRTKRVDQSVEYTFSADIYVNEFVKDIDIFWLSDTEADPKTGDTYANITHFLASFAPTPGMWQRIARTFTTKSDDYTGFIRIDNNGTTTSGTEAVLKVANLKLEKGNRATDWTPAPEDTEAATDEAAKTATNFVEKDATDGVIVGDKSSGEWTGYRTQIKTDSFNVVDADGNTMSMFGANEIQLGNDGGDTVVSLCNGRLKIKYVADDYDFADFISNFIRLNAAAHATIQAGGPIDNGDGTANVLESKIDLYNSSLIELTSNAYTIDADGFNVGDIDFSALSIQPTHVSISAAPDNGGVIYLYAPTITMQGGVGVDGDVDVTGNAAVSGMLEAVGATSMCQLRAQHYWLGFYPSHDDAKAATNRGGYIGINNGVMMIVNEGETLNLNPGTGAVRFYANKTVKSAQLTDTFRPAANDSLYLGNATYKWKSVYAVNGTIQTSDRNEKHNIEELSDKHVAFFDKLLPVSFVYNDGDRTHIGFIAQDVETAMAEVGLTALDFAGFCKDVKKTPEVLDEDGNVVEPEAPVLDENGEPVYAYSLRYTEFIALNSKMIQVNRKRISDLQNEVDDLKKIVAELCEKVGATN